MTTDDFTTAAWSALGGDPAAATAVEYREVPGALASPLPVRQLARATVAACSLAAAELLAERNGTEALAMGVPPAGGWGGSTRAPWPRRSPASASCASTAGR
ncbi:hypothetical protein E6W39_22455 [Kitasatospora acidiphila]|uniref:Uncharacterized protein n=1 Tax=Kitasatospora acidiphila TaxID=2567942 RepID=A0A540W7Z7_9ACTN|nr:hypothetical protein E6W39_22455 [Kitasatospora acidiphila]